ncbi:uncharacterized protein LOC112903851 [Agrilus planipennis]|uniref:Uncharacterized protein LOC112903851 n=1 Tax=Agrilus planipennis TaxID=224129 RepID=A0A7F5R3V4_AGRPL|nr:uncharacterized protein LOC112903851 [Agrilus planipennis]
MQKSAKIDSMMSEIEEGSENTLVDDDEPSRTAEDALLPSTSTINVPSNQMRTRKHRKVDEVELKLLKALEPVTPCSKMSFLQSLMPHLKHYTDGEFLHFQMGVLNVIENINKSKEATPQPQTNYSFHVPSYYSAFPHLSQPPPEHQSFVPAKQPSYPPQQYPPHISNVSEHRHTSPPHHSNRLKNSATPVYNAIPRTNRTQSTTESQTTLQPLSSFCYSDCSTEYLASPTTPSGESTCSDQIDFV